MCCVRWELRILAFTFREKPWTNFIWQVNRWKVERMNEQLYHTTAHHMKIIVAYRSSWCFHSVLGTHLNCCVCLLSTTTFWSLFLSHVYETDFSSSPKKYTCCIHIAHFGFNVGMFRNHSMSQSQIFRSVHSENYVTQIRSRIIESEFNEIINFHCLNLIRFNRVNEH